MNDTWAVRQEIARRLEAAYPMWRVWITDTWWWATNPSSCTLPSDLRRAVVRMILVAGVAVVVVAAASGEGCDAGSSAATCPELDNGAAAAGLVHGTRAAVLASDLEKDLERARDIAQDVSDATDGTCKLAGNGKGYRVRVPMTHDEDDDRIILVRVMARGGGRENYYRVGFPPKAAVDEDGEYSSNEEATHHEISDDAVSEILDLIDKIRDRET